MVSESRGVGTCESWEGQWVGGRRARAVGLGPASWAHALGLRRTGSLATVRPPLSLPHVHHPRYVLYAWGGL